MSVHLYGASSRRNDTSSVDSQFADMCDVRFLDACIECDDDLLYDIIQDDVTSEEVNERDRSGRTGLSHACANGFIPVLTLLEGLEDVDVNLPDNEGNTPLIFAAQAGHDDVVNILLRHFRRIRIDDCNNLGFTALMKAAIQGRTRCAKLLLFAGANPNRRDQGRKLCAEQWARFCGRHSCADAIAKYIRSKKYFFTKTFLLSRMQKWNSEPDLATAEPKTRDSGGWIQRHLSMKKRKKNSPSDSKNDRRASATPSLQLSPPSTTMRAGSAPMLVMSPADDDEGQTMVSRPKLTEERDGTGTTPELMVGRTRVGTECDRTRYSSLEPPSITQTDFDKELLESSTLIVANSGLPSV